MNRTKAEAIVIRLLANAAGLKYGTVSVSAKLHDGRVVEVAYSTTENTREPVSSTERASASEGSPLVRKKEKDE
uniref:Uncharacterized protein n=1 Tax=uncultured bacterium contig00013 TaxID=1181504 RepID=A0A806K0T9_9BACT|nr:hypothetical protein [uncultured bacterium contig00013]